MKTDKKYIGDLINIDFEEFTPRSIFDSISEFANLLLVYQQIAICKKSSSFEDDIKLLIPLAIHTTFVGFDTAEKKVSFVFFFLKNYTIEIRRGEPNAPQKKRIVITKPEALCDLTQKEWFEALVATVNYRRGTEEKNAILEGLMQGIRHEYGSIEEIIKEYININPKTFEEVMLKLGFLKKD